MYIRNIIVYNYVEIVATQCVKFEYKICYKHLYQESIIDLESSNLVGAHATTNDLGPAHDRQHYK